MNKYNLGDLVSIEGLFRITSMKDICGKPVYQMESKTSDEKYFYIHIDESRLIPAPQEGK